MEKVTRRVVLNLDRCVECKSCSAACFYGHIFYPGVEYGQAPAATIPIICKQCDEPACVEACSNEAMKRDENGVVWRSLMLCTGCKSCINACPFGVLGSDLNVGQVGKCDFCKDKLAVGLEPRCVSTCPSGALKFAEEEELRQEGLLVLSSNMAGSHPVKRR